MRAIRPSGLGRRLTAWTAEAALVGGTTFLTVLPSVLTASRIPLAPQDEGVLLTYPSLLLQGAIPNRTFESVYGPTWIWAMAAAFETFGHSLVVERLVGVGYRLALAGAVYLLLRRQGRLTAWCSAVLTSIIAQVAFVGALSVFGAMALAVFALAVANSARETGSSLLASVAAVAAGLALGFRPDTALPVAVSAGLVCLGWSRRQQVIGAVWLLVALLPVWVNLEQASPERVLRGELLDPLFVMPPGRTLPFRALPDSVAGVAIMLTAAAGLACLTTWKGARRGNAIDRRLLSLSAFSLALFPYMHSRWDLPHVAFVAMTTVAVVPALVQRTLLSPNNRSWIVHIGVADVALLACIACKSSFAYPYSTLLHGGPAGYELEHNGRRVPVASAFDKENLRLVLADVEQAGAISGRRLAVLPSDPSVAYYNDTFLYFMLPRFTPSTFYLEMEPGVANGSSSGLGDDLRQTDVIITNSRYVSSSEPNDAVRHGSMRATKVLLSEFREQSRHGPWTILVHR